MIVAHENGQVELFYDNSQKFRTHSTGVNVGGEIHINNSDTQIEEGANNSIRLSY